MDINELTIGEARELTRMFSAAGKDGKGGDSACGCGGGSFRPAAEGELAIFVLQRGWVVVGEYSQEGDTGLIKDAKVIRNWGTKEGLGELAEKGPLRNTVLDPCPPVRFHIRELIFAMEVNLDNWRKKGEYHGLYKSNDDVGGGVSGGDGRGGDGYGDGDGEGELC